MDAPVRRAEVFVRLAIVNLFYPPDLAPSAHFAASLAEHRARAGDTVTVITGRGGYLGGRPHAPAGDEPAATAGPAPWLRVVRTWTPALGKSTITRRLGDYLTFLLNVAWRLTLLPAQDVIIVLTTPPYLELAAVPHGLLHPRTRLVLWSHDVYPDAAEEYGAVRPGGLVSRGLRALKRWLFRRVDHVVALDRAMLDRQLSRYGRAGRPSGSVIPNWEPLGLFPSDLKPEPWEVAAAHMEGRFLVLYLGNLSYGHPTDTIVAAAARLADEPFGFVFVGGGTRYPELRERTHGMPNVLLHDYVPKEETPRVLAAADCTIVSLDHGSVGIMSPCKVHGSLAMAVPVVYLGPEGTNVDEAIAAFGCGFSLRQGDVDGLVDALRRLRDDHDLAAWMSANARRAFDTAYCDARTLPRFDVLLEELTARAGGHPSVPPG